MTVAAFLAWIAGLSLSELVGGGLSAVVSGFGGYKALVWIQERRGKRFVVKLAKSTNDWHFEQFQILYRKLIDESIRIDVAAIERAVDQGTFGNAKHQLYFCIHEGEVLGFCQVFVSQANDLAFISYLAVDSQKIAREAEVSRRLCGALRKVFSKRALKRAIVLFEVESPNAPSLSSSEKTRRRAMITQFKRLGKGGSKCVYEIDLPYIQPEVPNDSPKTNEHLMRLLAVLPKDGSTCPPIDRDELRRWLKYIYFDLYAAVYANDPTLDAIYRERLQQIIGDLEANCPKTVPLVA